MIDVFLALALVSQQAAKPYTGPHTLSKTWGDQFPGLKERPKPLHATAGKTTVTPVNSTPASNGSAIAKLPAPTSALVPKTSEPPLKSASSQTTIYAGGDKSTDGRIDVMHFHDGKMAVTMGRNWNCSYVSDPVQRKVVIICDGSHAK